MHESAVVDSVHSQGADEIAFHHPEGFRQEKGVGQLDLDPVHDLAPELVGYAAVELLGAHAVGGSSCDVSACSRLGIPEPLDMPLCKGHGCIESNDGEVSGNRENLLNDGLTSLWIEKIQLCSVIPGHCCTVIAMEDVGGETGPLVHTAEGYGGIGPIVVMVFNSDIDVGIIGKIRSVVCV